ncbi:unnamed protein product [Lathyrus oleraceus]
MKKFLKKMILDPLILEVNWSSRSKMEHLKNGMCLEVDLKSLAFVGFFCKFEDCNEQWIFKKRMTCYLNENGSILN